MERDSDSLCRRYLCEYEEIPSERWFEPLGLSFSRYPSSSSISTSDGTSLSRNSSICMTPESSDGNAEDNSKHSLPAGEVNSNKVNRRMNFNLWGRRKKRPSNLEEEGANSSEDSEATAEGLPDNAKSFMKYPLFRRMQRFSPREALIMTRGGWEIIENTGRGSVYDRKNADRFKGQITPSKLQVLVLRYDEEWAFLLELRAFSIFEHRNIARCVGWCQDEGKFLIVLEDMANGTLRSWIESQHKVLPWDARYKISIQLANAICYLHGHPDYAFPHRNIISSNVLLDSQWNAKLSSFVPTIINDHDVRDFGLSSPSGSFLAPECLCQQKISSEESDMFYLGIVIIEIASGKIITWPSGWRFLRDTLPGWFERGKILEAADKRLGREFDALQMEKLLVLGISCTQKETSKRPSINQVLQVLNSEDKLSSMVYGNKQLPSVYSNSPQNNDIPSVIKLSANKEAPPVRAAATESCTDVFHETTTSDLDSGHYFSAQPDEVKQPSSPVRELDKSRLEDGSEWMLGIPEELFDIGIPPGYGDSEAKIVEEFQAQIFKGYVSGLHKRLAMGARFDEVLDTIKKLTAAMVMLQIPLHDWNSIAQYVLKALRAIHTFERENGIELILLESKSSSLEQEILEDEKELAHSHLKLASFKEEHTLLVNELDDTQKKIMELQLKMEDVRSRLISHEAVEKDIESNRIMRAERLRKRKTEYHIHRVYDSMISELQSFSAN